MIFFDNSLGRAKSSSGLALLLVMFIVALASIIVFSLTYSTYLGSRIAITAERSVQAEYILKSALNFGRALLKFDTTEEDSSKDFWANFANGMEVPNDILGISVPNLRVSLEIRPEGAKIYLKSLVPSNLAGTSDNVQRDTLFRLFQSLGFDNTDDQDLYQQNGDQVFSSKEMVANLIDFIDSDRDAYNQDGFQGMESTSIEFPNRQIANLGELSTVPGFTPGKIQKLLPYVTTNGNSKININLAPRTVLRALDDELTDGMVDALIAFRTGEDGPFTSTSQVNDIINDQQIFNNISSRISTDSKWFQILSKVDYGTSTFFLRAMVIKGAQGELPEIRTMELF